MVVGVGNSGWVFRWLFCRTIADGAGAVVIHTVHRESGAAYSCDTYVHNHAQAHPRNLFGIQDQKETDVITADDIRGRERTDRECRHMISMEVIYLCIGAKREGGGGTDFCHKLITTEFTTALGHAGDASADVTRAESPTASQEPG